jgi:hypothetical protein
MRDSVLVFIDGTICDLQHRHKLKGTACFEKESEIMQDKPVGADESALIGMVAVTSQFSERWRFKPSVSLQMQTKRA